MRNYEAVVTSTWSVHGTMTHPQVSLYIPMDGGIVSVNVSQAVLTAGSTPNLAVVDQHGVAHEMSPKAIHLASQAIQGAKYVLSLMHTRRFVGIPLSDGTPRLVVSREG